MTLPRFVVDTNVLVSALLFPTSVPRQALERILADGTLLISEATLREFAEVMARPKFDAYMALRKRQALVELIAAKGQTVPILRPIRACRDPKDDKFLEVAAHGDATFLLTGDADLLALHPFSGVAILTPAAFLEPME